METLENEQLSASLKGLLAGQNAAEEQLSGAVTLDGAIGGAGGSVRLDRDTSWSLIAADCIIIRRSVP